MSGGSRPDGFTVHIIFSDQPSTPWARLRKRGVVLTFAVITSAMAVILEFLGWTPWGWWQ